MNEEIVNKPKFSFLDFYKKNRNKIFLIFIFIFISIISIIALDNYKKKQNIDISKKYNSAKILIENKKNKEALTILEKIIFKKNSFYSPSALNLIIDNNLVTNKKKVLSYYDQIITNSKLDSETKNLFIFKKVIYIGDDIEENDLLNNLNPIIKTNSFWKNTVLDYIKKFYLSRGEFNKAKEFEISKK